ncbi:MAG TPA: hypothetical protein VN678_12410 [Acidobacteriaceae bacterium]|nr:hypothetical protein [Acidobacteriaceae bacterium]
MALDPSINEESPSAALASDAAETAAPLPEPSSYTPALAPSTHEEPAPMIDVHPPHQTVHTWKDFLIHMSAICLGLLIAIGLEQTVEYFHHRHQASEARVGIQQELLVNAGIIQHNSDRIAIDQQQLAKDMDVLNSNAPDAQALSALQYSWFLTRPNDAAWNAAKTNGSIALIAPREIGAANYFYLSNDEMTPVVFSYMTDMDAAAAIVDHARIAGRLDQSERDQLRSLTAAEIGRARVFSAILPYQLNALKDTKLDR